MPVHLLKLAVGIESIDHLYVRQKERIAERYAAGEGHLLRILTRNTPRRAEELIAEGGSIFWVIKGRVLVRQNITSVEQATGQDGAPRCAIYMDPNLVRVRSLRFRPFQGWRYLEDNNAPSDLSSGVEDEVEPPSEMADELRKLGLI
jgi:hypothetical protein